jgi:hypothetical protein
MSFFITYINVIFGIFSIGVPLFRILLAVTQPPLSVSKIAGRPFTFSIRMCLRSPVVLSLSLTHTHTHRSPLPVVLTLSLSNCLHRLSSFSCKLPSLVALSLSLSSWSSFCTYQTESLQCLSVQSGGCC